MDESYIVDLEKTLVRLKTDIELLKRCLDACQASDSTATDEVKKLREELRKAGILR